MAGEVRLPWLRRFSVVAAVLLRFVAPAGGQSYFEACDAQYENVAESVGIKNGQAAVREIQANHTHRFEYTNYNLSTMQLNDTDRKVIISLEPCYGIVYLFVRKNIACHPDPYSCINLETGYRDSTLCRRTHFMTDINGSLDGAPTFFRISLSSSRYYISVFAATDSRYSLTVLDDVGAWPLRGNAGSVEGAVVESGRVMLQWSIAEYHPQGVSETARYHVYAVLLAENDTLDSPNVFLRPSKILNTYCGLQNNTDRADDTVDAALCDSACNSTISGLLNGRTYAFNVVAESQRGFFMAYAGTTLEVTWSSAVALGVVDSGTSGARRLMEEITPTPRATARRLVEISAVPMDPLDWNVAGIVSMSVAVMVSVPACIFWRFRS